MALRRPPGGTQETPERPPSRQKVGRKHPSHPGAISANFLPAPGRLLGGSWRLLGRPWAALGALLAASWAAPWALLVASGPRLGRSWESALQVGSFFRFMGAEDEEDGEGLGIPPTEGLAAQYHQACAITLREFGICTHFITAASNHRHAIFICGPRPRATIGVERGWHCGVAPFFKRGMEEVPYTATKFGAPPSYLVRAGKRKLI